MKFFDMRLSFVSKEERKRLGATTESKFTNNAHLFQEKNYILAPVLRAIKQGHRVEVLKTLKANGENVQVSYCKAIEAWVVCSKNVAILVQSSKQI